jgi:hypothetical protein
MKNIRPKSRATNTVKRVIFLSTALASFNEYRNQAEIITEATPDMMDKVRLRNMIAKVPTKTVTSNAGAPTIYA